MRHTVEIRRVLEEFFNLRSTLSSCPSPTGGQLERAKLGFTGKKSKYTDTSRLEKRYARYALLVKVWNTLSELEQKAIVLRYTPIGSREYLRTVHNSDLRDLYVPFHDLGGECQAVTVNGGRCRIARIAGEARCYLHRSQQAHPVTKVTYRGEEMLYSSDENENYSVVRGSNPVYPTNDQIAEKLGISRRQLQTLFTNAYKKIENSSLFSYTKPESMI